MEEINFYNDSLVTVTSSRIVMPNLTFALRNISSVRNHSIAPSHGGDIILIIIGLLIAMTGFCVGKGGGIIAGIIGLGLIAFGIYLYMNKKPTYFVYLGTNAGEQKGIESKDKEYVDNIVKAINEAIIHKG